MGKKICENIETLNKKIKDPKNNSEKLSISINIWMKVLNGKILNFIKYLPPIINIFEELNTVMNIISDYEILNSEINEIGIVSEYIILDLNLLINNKSKYG